MQSDLGPGGEQLQGLTEDTEKIKELNKSAGWKLKGIVSQISLQIFLK